MIADTLGLSDPYVVATIPGKKNTTYKTKYIEQDLNPVWNEQWEVPGFELGDTMKFTVWDKDFITSDDLLGRCSLSADELAGGFDGELMLDEAGDKQGKAFLKLRVTPHYMS